MFNFDAADIASSEVGTGGAAGVGARVVVALVEALLADVIAGAGVCTTSAPTCSFNSPYSFHSSISSMS